MSTFNPDLPAENVTIDRRVPKRCSAKPSAT